MAAQKRVGVVLAGCGYLDGAEIQEAVCTLLALDRRKAKLVAMAPDLPQLHVVDHVKGAPVEGERRNVLAESGRIVRGQIRPLASVSAADLDALIFPGGFGAAKNLCDFAEKGAAATPHPEVARLLREMHAAKKPIGAICIAPAVVASVLGKSARPLLTIGDDPGTAQALTTMGARHQDSPVNECVVDREQRIVTAPAYMFDARLQDIAAGIRKLCAAVVAMAGGAAGGGR
jgi:enhancing lycopene biosynthesis protein 2